MDHVQHTIAPMKSAFDLANNLHRRSRRTSLLNKAMQRLRGQEAAALRLDREEVQEVRHISHFLYCVNAGRQLLVSMVFNRDDIPRFVAGRFGTVVLNRAYQDVWYDLEMC